MKKTRINNENRYTLQILTEKLQRKSKDKRMKIFECILVFDDHIRCNAIRSKIEKYISAVKNFKKKQLLESFEINV